MSNASPRFSEPRPASLRPWFAVLLVLLLTAPLAAQHRQHVLLLHSYASPMTWVDQMTLGVQDALRPTDRDLDLRIEFMDTKRFHSPGYLDAFRDILTMKYADTAFDLVVSADNNAYDFLRRHRDELFPGAPVVFCGVNDFQPADIAGLRGFTGVAEVYATLETVETMLRLHPGTRSILVVNDHLATGRANRQNIDRVLAPLSGRVRIEHNEDLPLADLERRIARLRSDELMLLGVYYADADGRHSTFERIGNRLMAASPVPTYCLLDFNLGGGVVGGRVTGAYAQGWTAGEMARTILDGADPDTMAARTDGATALRFDHAALERWGIEAGDLPPGSEVVNRPVSIFEQNRDLVIGGSAVILVLVLIITLLTANIQRRHLAEQSLRESEQDLSITLYSIGDGVIATDEDGLVTRMNPIAAALTGWSQDEARGRSLAEVFRLRPPEAAGTDAIPWTFDDVMCAGDPLDIARGTLLVARDGTERLIADSGAPIRSLDGDTRGVVIVFRDVTERVHLEEQLQQSQKMESIGQLAGGIAHDFNNVLTGIMGYADLLQSSLGHDEDLQDCATSILQAGERAAGLTRKLLDFSRKGKILSTPIDAHEVISDTVDLVRHTLGQGITLEHDLAARHTTVVGDPTQIQQALLNLCLNGRDAMPDGGVLTVTTRNVDLDQARCLESGFDLHPGRHLRITVRDTGVGMTEEIRDHIFEPFFTTKAAGKGTGLGLAAVYGSVKDHQGAVSVESAVGRGTTFTVDLPTSDTVAVPALQDRVAATAPRRGCVLVVDDDATIRSISREMLGDLGYEVLVAEDGAAAIEVFERDRARIDVVLLDMVMPRLSGRHCFQALRRIDPDARVVLTSGFTAEHAVQDMLDAGLRGFLRKPFRRSDLIEALDSARANRRRAGGSDSPGMA